MYLLKFFYFRFNLIKRDNLNKISCFILFFNVNNFKNVCKCESWVFYLMILILLNFIEEINIKSNVNFE